MTGIHDLSVFIISGLLLNMMPGPDTLLIMSRSASQGWRAGSAAALGIGSGTLVHILAAALGMSAILAASSAAFTVVKLAGAAYLIYLGCRMLLARSAAANAAPTQNAATAAQRAAPARLTHGKIFVQGMLTNVLNPKVALFFLAFVPQFIAPDAPHKALAFVLLGLIFNFNGMLWCHLVAVLTASASSKIRLPASLLAWLNRALGGLLLTFGVKLALARQQ